MMINSYYVDQVEHLTQIIPLSEDNHFTITYESLWNGRVKIGLKDYTRQDDIFVNDSWQNICVSDGEIISETEIHKSEV